MFAKLHHLGLTHCNSEDHSLPVSSVPVFLQARTLEWIALLSSRVYIPYPGSKPVSLMSTSLAGKFFTTSTTWEAHLRWWVTESCLTLCYHMDCIDQGILQAGVLEWVYFPFSSDWTQGWKPGLPCCRWIFTSWATRGAHLKWWFGPFQGILFSFPVYLPTHIRDTHGNQYLPDVFINLWMWRVGVVISQPGT